MTNSRKTVWIIFGIYLFVQMGTAYLVDKNQEDLTFLLNMKKYIPFMLYFSLAGVVLFMFAFMFYQMDNIKANKQITQLESEKNQLKAKLFDMQEAQTPEKLLSPKRKPDMPPSTEPPANPEDKDE